MWSQSLKTCDLIFVPEGNSDFSNAISSATGDTDSLNFIHVGIIEITNNEINVIEADPGKGVRIIPLEVFLQNCPRKDGKPFAVVKRLNRDFSDDEVLTNIKGHIGEPYDWWYLPDNNKMYCSELVYEGYIDNEGHKIFKTKPMNFKGPDGTYPDFWINLFNEIGEDIPQGVPGTNPNDLAKDSCLFNVKSFF